ncbi:WhiB family transcriptional regulator [Nonomuraea sp. NPDC049784]|uniref:WhiB family transcriptional regulator n=1 Tax=Nonomuraea sp. NPDC049784 TaxID=3154361 RepID=UPI0033DD7BE3
MSTIMAPPATTTNHNDAPLPPLDLQLRAEAHSLVEKIDEHGICVGTNDNRWFAQGMTRRRARLLCAPCTVRPACLRLAIIEEALSIHVHGGSIHELCGARGGETGSARTAPVKELVDQLKAEKPRRKTSKDAA